MVNFIQTVFCLIEFFIGKFAGLAVIGKFPVEVVQQAVHFHQLAIELRGPVVIFGCLG